MTKKLGAEFLGTFWHVLGGCGSAVLAAPPLAAGKHMIAIDTAIKGPGQAGTVTLTVDGKQVGKANLKRTVPATFTAT